MSEIIKLSLIICSKDRSQKLASCLEAISSEEMLQAKGELILVDNGSTDDTENIMYSFQNKSQFPVHVIKEPKIGLSRARNRGLEKARGEIIIFTDDDCYLSKNYLVIASTIFDSGEFDYCGGQIQCYDKDDAKIAVKYFKKKAFIEPYTFILAGTIQGANMIFSRKVTKKIGFFDTMFGHGASFACEDIDYVARAAWAGFRGALIPDLIVLHHHGRRLPEDIKNIWKSYEDGMVAYHMKFILRGKLIYLKNWYRMFRKSKEAPIMKMHAGREIKAVLRYLITIIVSFFKNCFVK